jgi:hypothetical protein
MGIWAECTGSCEYHHAREHTHQHHSTQPPIVALLPRPLYQILSLPNQTVCHVALVQVRGTSLCGHLSVPTSQTALFAIYHSLVILCCSYPCRPCGQFCCQMDRSAYLLRSATSISTVHDRVMAAPPGCRKGAAAQTHPHPMSGGDCPAPAARWLCRTAQRLAPGSEQL